MFQFLLDFILLILKFYHIIFLWDNEPLLKLTLKVTSL